MRRRSRSGMRPPSPFSAHPSERAISLFDLPRTRIARTSDRIWTSYDVTARSGSGSSEFFFWRGPLLTPSTRASAAAPGFGYDSVQRSKRPRCTEGAAPLFVVKNPAGKLVTYRVGSPIDDVNAAQAAAELRTTIVAVGRPVVVCTDLTDARTFSERVADEFVVLMRSDNPKIERSALLLSDTSATFLLQMDRMVREAASPARRIFRDRQALRGWLHPVLSNEEGAALEAFLSVAKASDRPKP